MSSLGNGCTGSGCHKPNVTCSPLVDVRIITAVGNIRQIILLWDIEEPLYLPLHTGTPTMLKFIEYHYKITVLCRNTTHRLFIHFSVLEREGGTNVLFAHIFYQDPLCGPGRSASKQIVSLQHGVFPSVLNLPSWALLLP